MKYYIRIIVLCLAALLSLGRIVVFAAEIKWKTTPYSHYSENENIQDLLADFFSSQGIGLICSETVKGKVHGHFKEKDPAHFFTDITRSYNLVWYYDGAAVFVYPAHEITSQILNPLYLKVETLKNTLESLEITDHRFGLKIVEDDRIIYVSGPERYVQLVSDLVQKLDTKAMAQRGKDDVVRVFHLKYAWADDKTFSLRENDVTIPGVATLLRNLITENIAPGNVSEKDRARLMASVSRLKGKGLARRANHEESAASDDEQQPPSEADPSPDSDKDIVPSDSGPEIGFVQADTRQNAVIVRDREEKMPYYEKILALLDVPAGLVEIKATIMDVDRNNLENLGVEWQFTSTFNDEEAIIKGGLNGSESLPEEGLPVPLGAGFNVATLIGDARNYFLARINALQKKGEAKILSRPSVLTLNNLEAQFEHSKTFYVRVAGNEEVDLFDINVGVVLRVTPHIIHEDEEIRVKLAIKIEDGDFSETDESVDDIPVVKKSVINTQAVIGQYESLLIGGYTKEEKIETRHQAPCLGDVPLLGWLFKKSSTTDSNTERLFLISPTIVPYNGTYGSGKTPGENAGAENTKTGDHLVPSAP